MRSLQLGLEKLHPYASLLIQTASLTVQAMISHAQPHYFTRIRMKHPSVGLQENMRLKMKTEMTIIQKWSPRLLSGKQATDGIREHTSVTQ